MNNIDIQKQILARAKKRGSLTVADMVKATGFSRVYVHRFFQDLTDKGKLVRVGHANRAHYVLVTGKDLKNAKKNILNFNRTLENKNVKEDQVFNLIKSETGIFEGVKENVKRILEYAFTEMLNNAIEHSGSIKIKTAMRSDGGMVRFDVIDWGMGIFEKLIHSRHLKDADEAIQDLLKGKQTTDPEAHSGEGIFFTRRIADTFIIRSSTKKLFFNNKIDDFTVTTIKPVFGTRVAFTLAINSKKDLRDVFNKYAEESFEFGATDVIVKLYEKGATDFISRSQARRVLYGLEKFKKITLDFKGVKAIGQGFTDEVFRVWQNKYPNINVVTKNTGEDIDFMIKRSRSSSGNI